MDHFDPQTRGVSGYHHIFEGRPGTTQATNIEAYFKRDTAYRALVDFHLM